MFYGYSKTLRFTFDVCEKNFQTFLNDLILVFIAVDSDRIFGENFLVS
ncbi:hypothetical protein LEP1GSC158_3872 [Leptospira interrogans serovar Zanoni str. LT2156]|uniref:Uncharacterized protein n=1 Tax=Leptospira interrogans serovar Zanoni str. LT2156 TaxID=1001601 RepID=M6I454_LEPIR|nr:hypothetical protein LEP1GSC158_3872 [Leptospira interrogans serovar Zanoni str. LT2156]